MPISRLAAALGVTEDAVRATLDRYPVFYDDAGAIIGFGGLTVIEMPPHRLNVGGRTLYAWCAWDALFIPAILGTVAQVESVCPVTRAPVSMVVGPTDVRDITPATAVVSFLTPDQSFDRNVIVNFCHFVHFFRTAEAGAEWIAQRPGTFLLTVEEAFSLGQLTNARNFGDVLGVGVAEEG